MYVLMKYTYSFKKKLCFIYVYKLLWLEIVVKN